MKIFSHLRKLKIVLAICLGLAISYIFLFAYLHGVPQLSPLLMIPNCAPEDQAKDSQMSTSWAGTQHLSARATEVSVPPPVRVPTSLSSIYTRSEYLARTCKNGGLQFAVEGHNDLKKFQEIYLNRLLVFSSKYQIVYCAIPKVGSSFWKRVFMVLGENSTDEKHLFDIPSYAAHKDFPSSMLVSKSSKKDKATILSTYTKFMFTRDPFSRLYSAYVDKMLVPNEVGIAIAKDIQKLRIPGAASLKCAQNVTFALLCNYVAYAILRYHPLEPHLAPMHLLCAPCLLNITLLGKMETFMEDTSDILRVVGLNLSTITGNVHDVDSSNDIGIINDVTTRVFTFLKEGRSTCLTMQDVLKRLWKHFQVRGFISKNIPYSPPSQYQSSVNITQSQFVLSATEAYHRSGAKEVRQRQREEAMIEAYRSVPPEILKRLALAFSADCTLFDYSCDVVHRFLNNTL